MQYIKFTYVDSKTKTSVDQEPARNGPAFPAIPTLQFLFALETEYPTAVPTFYGRYEQPIIEHVQGIIEQITSEQALSDHKEELRLRVQAHANTLLGSTSELELVTQINTNAQQLTDQIDQSSSHEELRDVQIWDGWPMLVPDEIDPEGAANP